MLFAKDIHDSVEEENALTDRALRDTLTGLYNKSATELLISQKLESDSRKDPAPLNALLLLDLDNFKAANDLMGHIFGDALLTEVSKKLTNVFRSSDILGRIGGDEFMVLMKDLPNEAVAIRKAHEARGVELVDRDLADLGDLQQERLNDDRLALGLVAIEREGLIEWMESMAQKAALLRISTGGTSARQSASL